ncbi:MAG: hypothetical protein ACAH88_04140 [Roseimicrobium sp.]
MLRLLVERESSPLTQEFQRQMGGLKFGKNQSIGLQIEGRPVSVPVAAARLLLDALASIAEGRTPAVVSLDEEVSPQEAAGLLNVSRPYAASLFDEGAILFMRVGWVRKACRTDDVIYLHASIWALIEKVQNAGEPVPAGLRMCFALWHLLAQLEQAPPPVSAPVEGEQGGEVAAGREYALQR